MTDSASVIEVSASEYLASMSLVDNVRHVADAEGAELHAIGDEHFIVLVCTCGIDHTGHDDLARLTIPAAWGCFHAGHNAEDEWEVYHYGPILPGDSVWD